MKQVATTCAIFVICGMASAQPAPPDYGFNFTTIGAVGNDAYHGVDLLGSITGHGSVSYEYRMARNELRTSQFVDFMSVLGTINPDFVIANQPREWGATGIIRPDGSIEFNLISQEAGDWPVSGFSWRVAAMYTNWLHNGKAETVDAFLSGAYDVSTFGYDPSTGNFTDQVTRSPGAKYWIPSVDEWLKAAHYDPNKDGPGEGGWWQYPNGSDTKPVSGIPGVGETNADLFDEFGYDAWEIPVGSYPETQSPWGLLDLSGGASEWAEDWLYPHDPYDRVADGTSIDTNIPPSFDPDLIGQGYIASRPDFWNGYTGLRIASAVPTPSVSFPLIACGVLASVRRRR